MLAFMLAVASAIAIYTVSRNTSTRSTPPLKIEGEGILDIFDMIVAGQVKSVDSRWDSTHTKIFTRVTMNEIDLWKGTSRPHGIHVDQIGGTVGETTMFVSSFPQPTIGVGDNVVLFLQKRHAAFQLVGFVRGRQLIEAVGLADGAFTMTSEQPGGTPILKGAYPGIRLLQDGRVPGVKAIFYMDTEQVYPFEGYVRYMKDLLR